jgi:predicted transcriptional regulator
MKSHFSPKQAFKLEQSAKQSPEEEGRFAEAIKLGESQLERGDYITHEQVGARIKQMLKS